MSELVRVKEQQDMKILRSRTGTAYIAARSCSIRHFDLVNEIHISLLPSGGSSNYEILETGFDDQGLPIFYTIGAIKVTHITFRRQRVLQ